MHFVVDSAVLKQVTSACRNSVTGLGILALSSRMLLLHKVECRDDKVAGSGQRGQRGLCADRTADDLSLQDAAFCKVASTASFTFSPSVLTSVPCSPSTSALAAFALVDRILNTATQDTTLNVAATAMFPSGPVFGSTCRNGSSEWRLI